LLGELVALGNAHVCDDDRVIETFFQELLAQRIWPLIAADDFESDHAFFYCSSDLLYEQYIHVSIEQDAFPRVDDLDTVLVEGID